MDINELIIAKRAKKSIVGHIVSGAVVVFCILIIMTVSPAINSLFNRFNESLPFSVLPNLDVKTIDIVGVIVISGVTAFLIYDFLSIRKWNMLPEYYITYDGHAFHIYDMTETYSYYKRSTFFKFIPEQRIIGNLVLECSVASPSRKITVSYIYDIDKAYRKITEITDKNEEYVNNG